MSDIKSTRFLSVMSSAAPLPVPDSVEASYAGTNVSFSFDSAEDRYFSDESGVYAKHSPLIETCALQVIGAKGVRLFTPAQAFSVTYLSTLAPLSGKTLGMSVDELNADSSIDFMFRSPRGMTEPRLFFGSPAGSTLTLLCDLRNVQAAYKNALVRLACVLKVSNIG